jgi:hypothetical protein
MNPNRNETRAPAPAGRHDRSGDSGPPSWPRGAPDRSMVPSKVNASGLRASHAAHAGSGPRCDPIVLGPRPQWEMTPRAKLRFASLLACHGKRSLACELKRSVGGVRGQLRNSGQLCEIQSTESRLSQESCGLRLAS